MLFALSALALVPVVLIASPTRRLSVQSAVEIALNESPLMNAARAQLDMAQAQADSIRGRLLPGIQVSDEQQRWNKPYQIPFGPAGSGVPPVTVREMHTNTFVAAASEPVVGLFHLSADYAGLLKSRDASQANLKATELLIREQVESDFLRLFEARAMVEIAQASEHQLEEQVEVAKSKLQAGALTHADVLRVQVAHANARQQEIQAQVQEQVARASLLEQVGLSPDDSSVDFEEPKTFTPAKGSLPELTASLAQAYQNRPELQSARLSAEAAKSHALAGVFSLLPEVNVEAAYSHVEGQLFAPPDSFFVGLKASWAVFEWGAQLYESRAKDAQASAAAAQAQNAQRRLGTEVATRLSQLRAAASALDVADTALASAKEAYRVTQALSRAGSATTTDLLDAQAALTQASLNLVRSRYAFAMSKVALTRTLGGGP